MSAIFMVIGFKIARSRADKNKQNWQPKFIRTCVSSIADFEQVLTPINIEANNVLK
jgi:hypothetical protein